MTLEKYLPSYEVLTNHNTDDYLEFDGEEADSYADAMVEEQNAKLDELGFDQDFCYVIHFFDSAFRDDHLSIVEIRDAVEMLAIKEGYDLVKFDNGRAGFVAYYGCNANGFEIIGCPESLKPVYNRKVESEEIEINEDYDMDCNFDSYIEYEDDLRELVNEL